MAMSNEEMLCMLLSNLFGSNVEELRIFLRGSDGPDILMHLPAGTASPFVVIGEAADVLRRRGALSSSFFEALRRHFPSRGPDIDSVSVLWEKNPKSAFFGLS